MTISATPATHEDTIQSPRSNRFSDSSASVLLDLLRGIAAVLVLLEHWRNIFFVDYGDISRHSPLWAAPYVVSGAGHQAVIVFFVLSGYLVGGTVSRAMHRGEWKWKNYLLRRVVRLWMVLLPALVACLFWDKLGMHLGQAPQMYLGANLNHIMPDNVGQLLSPRIFFGNLLFLQGIRVHTYGSDGALWSLANEFWYYILFPLGFLAVHPSSRMMRRFISAAFFLLVAWQVGMGILLEFPIWLMGALLLRMPSLSLRPQVAYQLRSWAAVFYSLAFFFLAKARRIPAIYNDYLLGFLTFMFVWLLLSATRTHPQSFGVRASRGLARFSYTLYAVHTPLMVFLGSLLVHDLRWQPNPGRIVRSLCALAAVIVYALGVAWLTEFRTDAAYAFLSRILGTSMKRSELPHRPTGENT